MAVPVEKVNRNVSEDGLAHISNKKPMTKKKKEEKKKTTYLDVAKKSVREKARILRGSGEKRQFET